MQELIPDLFDFDELGQAVHVYLWRWDGGLTLIDTGLPGAKNCQKILNGIERLGYAPRDVQRIVVTHMDLDHVGNLRALKRATGAEIVCHTVEKQFLENPARRKPAGSLAGILLRPLFRLVTALPQFRVQPVSPDRTLMDGEKLPEGFVVVHTPGHTPGHISLFHPQRQLLITGDALSNFSGKIGPPPALFTPDADTAHRSIWKLAKKYADEIETVAFGHGPAILEGGGSQIQGLASQLFEDE